MRLASFAATCLYGAMSTFLAAIQRRLLYFPDRSRPQPALAGVPAVQECMLRTSDGLELLSWYAPAQDEARPVVLYLHGNGGSIGGRAQRLSRLNAFGWGVLLVEYRGFGGNPGRPSEAGLAADAAAGYAALRDVGIDAARILLWGESLGTGVAVRLGAENAAAALLLENPYTSVADLARLRFPWLPTRLVQDRFELVGRMGAVRMPVLVMASGQDEVIPVTMGRAVFAAAPSPKSYWLAPHARHNELAAAGALDAARGFVRQHVTDRA